MGFGATRLVSIITIVAVLVSVGGVFATWIYLDDSLNEIDHSIPIELNEFVFAPETPDMPENEVSLLERLDDILNQRYTTDVVTDSRAYLLEQTIKVEWEPGAPPYVGSMDPDYAVQINELFGDIIPLGVSFILKNQDLNWDYFPEISLYSTSDPLDCVEEGFDGIVAVYLSVFTPLVDDQNNIIGYELVCDSLYGFCNEVYYNPENPNLSSFSTTDWRENMVYWHHELGTQPIPYDAIGFDGQTLYRYHYDSYHYRQYVYEGYPWAVGVWLEGKTASDMLAGKIPWIEWK